MGHAGSASGVRVPGVGGQAGGLRGSASAAGSADSGPHLVEQARESIAATAKAVAARRAAAESVLLGVMSTMVSTDPPPEARLMRWASSFLRPLDYDAVIQVPKNVLYLVCATSDIGAFCAGERDRERLCLPIV